jgi:hypothetical protein
MGALTDSLLGTEKLILGNGNRSFLTRAYPTMKKNNPHIPIMVRDAQGTIPKVYARYGAWKLLLPSIGDIYKIVTFGLES